MSYSVTPNLGIRIPDLFAVDPKTKEIVIGAIKLVLRRLKSKGLVETEFEYAGLLQDPAAMHEFISQFKAHRDIGADLAVDKTGQPVKGLSDELVCGLTLAQVERMLVYTCGKKVFAQAAIGAGWDGKMTKAVKDILAFDWQLPLLKIYAHSMSQDDFDLLEDGILLIRNPIDLQVVANAGIDEMKKAKQLAGEDFYDMLRSRARAVRGIVRCTPKQLAFFKEVAGERVWEFLGGDPHVIAEVLTTTRSRLEAMGPNIADLCLVALHILEEVSTGSLGPFMESFRKVFGDDTGPLLSNERFCKEYLIDIVGTFRNMPPVSDADAAAYVEAAALKLQAIHPKVMAWKQAAL